MSGKDEVDVISKFCCELMIGVGVVVVVLMVLFLFFLSGMVGVVLVKYLIYLLVGEVDCGNKIVMKDGVEIFYKDWGKG